MQESAEEEIRALAEGCARFVRQAVGMAPDGTPETLPILDHYLGLAREGEAGARQEVLGLVATAAGAYFGEVVRQAVPGARWHRPDREQPAGWRLEVEHVFLALHPVGMAREAILGREEDGGPAQLAVLPRDRGLLEQALDHVGAVGEDDYYRLAVRWEVIEQALAVLEAAAAARGEIGRRYGPDAYAAALDRAGEA